MRTTTKFFVILGFLLPAVPAGAAVNEATISNFSFSPEPARIPVGATLTWTNKDSSAHTVTADDGSWTSTSLNKDGTFSHAFSQPGTVRYHCAIHDSMTGTVVVEAAGPTTTTTAAPTTTTTQATTTSTAPVATPTTTRGQHDEHRSSVTPNPTRATSPTRATAAPTTATTAPAATTTEPPTSTTAPSPAAAPDTTATPESALNASAEGDGSSAAGPIALGGAASCSSAAEPRGGPCAAGRRR